MRILVTGAAGMLGQDLVGAASAAGHQVSGLAHAELDVVDPDRVQTVIGRAAPHVVVNCAAWTDVDSAELEPERALEINGPGAGHVAAAAAAAGAWTIQLSSDYVFDGAKREPYLESDPADPLSVYGRSKLAGELAVARVAPGAHTTVRSAWLFGTGGECFPKTIARLAADRDELTVVDDQIGCPTFTGHLAGALVELSELRIEGIVHVAGGGSCSWCELAAEVVTLAGLQCEVKPGTTADQARPASRPAYSALASERSGTPRLPDWRAGLGAFMESGLGS